LPAARFLAIFPAAVAKVYIVKLRTPRRPPTVKVHLVLADNMRATIDMAWEHGGAQERGRAGAIAGTKSGRYVLFKRSDVEAYFDEHCKKEPMIVARYELVDCRRR